VFVHKGEEASLMKRFLLFAYGAPAVVAGATAALSELNVNAHQSDGGSDMCWLSGPWVWAFVGPVIFVVVVNLWVFGKIIRIILSLRRRNDKSKSPHFDR
jgi:hypothetical protein